MVVVVEREIVFSKKKLRPKIQPPVTEILVFLFFCLTAFVALPTSLKMAHKTIKIAEKQGEAF